MKENPTLHISTYHGILLCAARLGDVKELKEIWKLLIERDHMVPDEQCYISAFICLGFAKKYNKFEDTELAKSMQNNMKNQYLSLLNRCLNSNVDFGLVLTFWGT